MLETFGIDLFEQKVQTARQPNAEIMTFYFTRYVCLSFLPCLGWDTGNTTSLTSPCSCPVCVGEDGQEIFSHDYRRDAEEH